MKYTTLGRTNLRVSRICLGTWQAYGWTTSNDKDFLETVSTALDCGINFIDTALEYGKGYSEKLVGKAIRGKRDKIILATKAPYKSSAPKELREALETSLTNLKTDYIDLYQQHWPPKTPPLEETISEMEKLKDEGKIRAIGVSNWMEQEWSELGDPTRVSSLQPCYSLLWRHIEKEVLPFCVKNNIAVIPYSPLGQGLLTGRYKELHNIPKDSRRNNVLTSKEVFPKVLNFLDILSEVAEKYKKSSSETALRWLLEQPGVTSIIVGCSRKDHIISNCKALGWELSEEDNRYLSEKSNEILQLTAHYKSLWNWHPRKD